jgi:hypothetical protein
MRRSLSAVVAACAVLGLVRPIAADVSHAAPECDRSVAAIELPLGVPTTVDKRKVYRVAGTSVLLCVVRTGYPYRGSGKGHQLWAMVDLYSGKDSATYDLSPASFARFHGVRIDVGMAKFDRSNPQVWIRATNAGTP